MVPLLDIKKIRKYLKINARPFRKVTECYGTISCLYRKTDNKIPFIVKFTDDDTMQIRHGDTSKLFKFTEDNYPLK